MKTYKSIIFAVITMVSTNILADTFGTGTNQFIIDFVNIGFADNAADTVDGDQYTDGMQNYGTVEYNYRIGMFEVTINQFMKAYDLDNRIGDGDEDYWNRNTRTVGSGAPASMVAWNEAAKFCNWLTTGDALTGVYEFNDYGQLTGINRSYRNNDNLAYVLPTEDEWYKAAFFKSDASGYSLYATGSDNDIDLIHGTPSGWNYKSMSGVYVNGEPNYMWVTGFGGEEQNGTYDMMGNVWEWCESIYDGELVEMSERVFRGGGALDVKGHLRSYTRGFPAETTERNTLGFRVASIDYHVPKSFICPAIEFGWTTVSGETYQIQYSTNLTTSNWFDLGATIIGDGATNSIFDTTRNGYKRFYRVITVP